MLISYFSKKVFILIIIYILISVECNSQEIPPNNSYDFTRLDNVINLYKNLSKSNETNKEIYFSIGLHTYKSKNKNTEYNILSITKGYFHIGFNIDDWLNDVEMKSKTYDYNGYLVILSCDIGNKYLEKFENQLNESTKIYKKVESELEYNYDPFELSFYFDKEWNMAYYIEGYINNK